VAISPGNTVVTETPVPGELVPQRLGVRALGRLRRAVGGGARERAQAGAARDDDDVAATGAEQVRQRRLDRVDRAEPVDARHLLDVLDRLLGDALVVGEPGVGDEEVDAAGLAREALDRRLDLGAVADVDAAEHDVGAGQGVGEGLELLGRPREQADGRAAGGEPLGQRAADAARGARHERPGAGGQPHERDRTGTRR
jgi:hypothetical protein